MGYAQEVEMIAHAHKLDLLTCPDVFNEDEAKATGRAGADLFDRTHGIDHERDVIRCQDGHHTRSGGCPHSSHPGSGRLHPSDILVLRPDGRIAEPHDVQYIL